MMRLFDAGMCDLGEKTDGYRLILVYAEGQEESYNYAVVPEAYTDDDIAFQAQRALRLKYGKEPAIRIMKTQALCMPAKKTSM